MSIINQIEHDYHINHEVLSESKLRPSQSSFSSDSSLFLGVSKEAEKASLGTYTKSSSLNSTPKPSNPLKTQGVRADRYALQNVIRKLILAHYDYQSEGIIDFDEYNKLPRVVKCARTRISTHVEVKTDPQFNKAFYSGLTVCGSVHTCPCCSAKIQEGRRAEVSQAMNWAYSNDLKAVMVTLTIPHYESQTCSDLLSSMKDAFKVFRTGNKFKKFKDGVGYQGIIRGFETLYGNNGWHHHTHELWFVDKHANADYIKEFILERWELACSKFCLIPRGKLRAFRKHSVDIWDNASESDYLSKHDDQNNLRWGADREIVSQSLKGSSKGIHPFQLADLWDKGYSKAGELFVEYLESFKGHRQLFWSPGLKKKVFDDGDQPELTDEELAALEPLESKVIATLEHFAWQEVLDQKARSLILDIAENHGSEGIDAWLKKYGLNQSPRF